MRITPIPRLLVLILLPLILASCSVKKMAVNSLADSLAASASTSLAEDDDLELVGDAMPFTLKLMEVLHDQAPENVGLYQALASGFAMYAMVYVQWPAEQLKYDDYAGMREGIERARGLFLRANGYAREGMELQHPGFNDLLAVDHQAALALATEDDVPMLYWLGTTWLAVISNSREDPAIIGDLPVAAAIIHRCLDLDEDYNRGSIHELLISLEPSLPMPGGVERAKEHYARAQELSGGVKAGTYLSLAGATCIRNQDRGCYEDLLRQALDVDVDASPEDRLANIYAQEKAQFLLDHLDDIFPFGDL